MIRLFHRNLLINLRKYHSTADPPSLVNIQVAWLKLTNQCGFRAMILGPVFRLRVVEISEFIETELSKRVSNKLNEVFRDPEFIKDLKFSLNKFQAAGVFDI